jgi:hypothetical protein
VRELLQVRFDQVGDLQEDSRALLVRSARPLSVCPFGGLDRALDVALVAVGHERIRLARRRVDVVEVLARRRLDEPAVDEVREALHGGAL